MKHWCESIAEGTVTIQTVGVEDIGFVFVVDCTSQPPRLGRLGVPSDFADVDRACDRGVSQCVVDVFRHVEIAEGGFDS